MLRLKRVYEKPEKGDGFRVLVDRLWPRGISRESARIDLWIKEIAPSGELRDWFKHEPEKWKEFEKKYWAELKDREDLVKEIKKLEKENKAVTLLFGAKEERYNNAVALKEYLEKF